MNKIISLVMIVVVVGIMYMFMILLQPTMSSIISSANTSINWTAHADFERAQAAMIGWPFWAYLIPGSLGIVAVIGVLKGQK